MKTLSTIVLAGLLAAGVARGEDSSLPSPLPAQETAKASGSGAAGGGTLTIPAETEATVQLLSGIHTQVNHVGDRVTAELTSPIYVDGQVALPRGSLLEGRITRLRAGRRLRRGAEVRLRFESVTFPDGQVQPVYAVLSGVDNERPLRVELDSEGALKGVSPFPWKVLTRGFTGLGALAVAQSQFWSTAALGASLPAGGGATFAYAFLWPRGSEVHIPPETQLRLRLHEPLTVRLGG